MNRIFQLESAIEEHKLLVEFLEEQKADRLEIANAKSDLRDLETIKANLETKKEIAERRLGPGAPTPRPRGDKLTLVK